MLKFSGFSYLIWDQVFDQGTHRDASTNVMVGSTTCHPLKQRTIVRIKLFQTPFMHSGFVVDNKSCRHFIWDHWRPWGPQTIQIHRGTSLNFDCSKERGTCEGFIDSQTGMLSGIPESAMCVQRFDDSLNSAIHITYRNSLRSSSLREPRDPLSKVVFHFTLWWTDSD